MANENEASSIEPSRMKWAILVLVLCLGSLIAAADLGMAQPLLKLLHDVPLADKFAHFLLFGFLCYLLIAGVSKMRVANPLVLSLGIIAALLVLTTAEEISQIWFSSRTFSVTDLLSNYAGILVFGGLALFMMAPSSNRS